MQIMPMTRGLHMFMACGMIFEHSMTAAACIEAVPQEQDNYQYMAIIITKPSTHLPREAPLLSSRRIAVLSLFDIALCRPKIEPLTLL